MKRTVDTINGINEDGSGTKRAKKYHHSIKNTQPLSVECLQGVQDEAFFQSQLLRSITLALSAQGFDSVETSALEDFRMMVEDCK